MNRIFHGDCAQELKEFPDSSVDLIYIDPPFNTGKTRTHGEHAYEDTFDDYLSFIVPLVKEAHRLLKANGSFFFHIDYREVHYCKVAFDQIFGRESFINEIIWSYDYGGRSKKRWSAKHDNILWYAKDPKNYTFNYDAIDRIPYLAPKLVGKEKAARGKTPTDSWWCSIVHTTGKERTGYPTQKPLKIIERIVKVHSNEGDTVLDFFAGSGTTGEAAAKNNREFILVDRNLSAVKVMQDRLDKYRPSIFFQGVPKFLAVFHRCKGTKDKHRKCVELRPFGTGFPRDPMVCPMCQEEGVKGADLRFALDYDDRYELGKEYSEV